MNIGVNEGIKEFALRKSGTLCMQGEADVTVEHITRMNIQQFRHFISNAKVAGGGFSAEKADESFAAMAPLCRVCNLVVCWLYVIFELLYCTCYLAVHVVMHAQTLTMYMCQCMHNLSPNAATSIITLQCKITTTCAVLSPKP